MPKLTGKKKAEFLARMAKGRKQKASARKTLRRFRLRKLTKIWKADQKTKAKKKANPGKRSGRRLRTLTGSGAIRYAEKHAPRHKPTKRRSTTKARGKSVPRARRATPRRRNSSIEQMYQTFHQKAPGRIVDHEQLVQYPDAFAELGELRELRFNLDSANKNFPLTRFGGTKVCCDARGENIYFVGGDQAIDFGALDMATDKDFVELGPCTYIAYKTTKGFHDFEPIIYFHQFGEENGILPVLMYDRLNKTLFLGSGDYRVRREGIVN